MISRNDQPLPIGAALLTTDLTNAAKVEVGVIDGYGMPQDIVSQLVARSIPISRPATPVRACPPRHRSSLTFFNPVCEDVASSGDCFGTLV